MSRVSGSCHMWVSRVTVEWVMSYVHESCHISMSRVAMTVYARLSYLLLCWEGHIWIRHVNHKWMSNVIQMWMSHVWMSHVTREYVMSHMNESCHTWMRHVTYEWVMSHVNASRLVSMSHVTMTSCTYLFNMGLKHRSLMQKSPTKETYILQRSV